MEKDAQNRRGSSVPHLVGQRAVRVLTPAQDELGANGDLVLVVHEGTLAHLSSTLSCNPS